MLDAFDIYMDRAERYREPDINLCGQCAKRLVPEERHEGIGFCPEWMEFSYEDDEGCEAWQPLR